MPIHVRILSNKLPGAPGKARSWAGRVTQQSAERVRDRAKGLVPRDTGETQAHIEAVKHEPFGWTVVSSRPSTDGDFDVPAFLEYKRHPYLRPALEEERGPFLAAMDKIIDGLV